MLQEGVYGKVKGKSIAQGQRDSTLLEKWNKLPKTNYIPDQKQINQSNNDVVILSTQESQGEQVNNEFKSFQKQDFLETPDKLQNKEGAELSHIPPQQHKEINQKQSQDCTNLLLGRQQHGKLQDKQIQINKLISNKTGKCSPLKLQEINLDKPESSGFQLEGHTLEEQQQYVKPQQIFLLQPNLEQSSEGEGSDKDRNPSLNIVNKQSQHQLSKQIAQLPYRIDQKYYLAQKDTTCLQLQKSPQIRLLSQNSQDCSNHQAQIYEDDTIPNFDLINQRQEIKSPSDSQSCRRDELLNLQDDQVLEQFNIDTQVKENSFQQKLQSSCLSQQLSQGLQGCKYQDSLNPSTSKQSQKTQPNLQKLKSTSEDPKILQANEEDTDEQIPSFDIFQQSQDIQKQTVQEKYQSQIPSINNFNKNQQNIHQSQVQLQQTQNPQKLMISQSDSDQDNIPSFYLGDLEIDIQYQRKQQIEKLTQQSVTPGQDKNNEQKISYSNYLCNRTQQKNQQRTDYLGKDTLTNQQSQLPKNLYQQEPQTKFQLQAEVQPQFDRSQNTKRQYTSDSEDSEDLPLAQYARKKQNDISNINQVYSQKNNIRANQDHPQQKFDYESEEQLVNNDTLWQQRKYLQDCSPKTSYQNCNQYSQISARDTQIQDKNIQDREHYLEFQSHPAEQTNIQMQFLQHQKCKSSTKVGQNLKYSQLSPAVQQIVDQYKDQNNYNEITEKEQVPIALSNRDIESNKQQQQSKSIADKILHEQEPQNIGNNQKILNDLGDGIQFGSKNNIQSPGNYTTNNVSFNFTAQKAIKENESMSSQQQNQQTTRKLPGSLRPFAIQQGAPTQSNHQEGKDCIDLSFRQDSLKNKKIQGNKKLNVKDKEISKDNLYNHQSNFRNYKKQKVDDQNMANPENLQSNISECNYDVMILEYNSDISNKQNRQKSFEGQDLNKYEYNDIPYQIHEQTQNNNMLEKSLRPNHSTQQDYGFDYETQFGNDRSLQQGLENNIDQGDTFSQGQLQGSELCDVQEVPWWKQLLVDFVPVALIQKQIDPRYNREVHINYLDLISRQQTSLINDKTFSKTKTKYSSQTKNSTYSSQGLNPNPKTGFWITEEGHIKVFVDKNGKKHTGKDAYKIAQQEAPTFSVGAKQANTGRKRKRYRKKRRRRKGTRKRAKKQ